MSSSSLPSLCTKMTRLLERRRFLVGELAIEGDPASSFLVGENQSGSSSSDWADWARSPRSGEGRSRCSHSCSARSSSRAASRSFSSRLIRAASNLRWLEGEGASDKSLRGDEVARVGFGWREGELVVAFAAGDEAAAVFDEGGEVREYEVGGEVSMKGESPRARNDRLLDGGGEIGSRGGDGSGISGDDGGT